MAFDTGMVSFFFIYYSFTAIDVICVVIAVDFAATFVPPADIAVLTVSTFILSFWCCYSRLPLLTCRNQFRLFLLFLLLPTAVSTATVISSSAVVVLVLLMVSAEVVVFSSFLCSG